MKSNYPIEGLLAGVVIMLLSWFVSTTAWSQSTWIGFTSNTPLKPNVQVLESSNQTVRYQISISGMYSEDIEHDREIFQRLSIPGGIKMSKQGWPELPIISRPVAIPDCGGMTFSIIVYDSIILNNYNVYPTPIIITDSTEGFLKYVEIFTKNDSAYSLNELIPGIKLESEKRGFMRNQKVMNMLFYPLRYNPLNRQLIIYTLTEVTIGFQNPTSDININNGIFSRITKNNLLNYTPSQLPTMTPGPASIAGNVNWITLSDTSEAVNIVADYLIITDDNFFNPIHSQYLQNLAEHRAQYNGFDVAIVSVQNILNVHFNYYPAPVLNTDWNYARQIRKFIMRVYDGKHASHTYDNRLAFLCLVGHSFGNSSSQGLVTSWDPNPTGGPGNDTTNSQSANDYYFSCVTRDNGNWDPYGDLFVGRLSVVTESDLQNIVEKTIHNETEYQIDPWKKNTTLAYGGAYVPGNPTLLHDYFCVSLPNWLNSLNSSYTSNVIDMDNSGPNWNSDYINYINSNGSNIVFHYGHGIEDSWCAQSVCDNVSQGSLTFAYKHDHLNNTNRYPFVMSQSCLTGAYTNVNGLSGMGELMTTYSKDKGYVAYLGSYTPIPLPMNQTGTFPVTFHERILQAVFQGCSNILGEAILEARLAVLYNNFDVCHFQNNLFGDPAINLMAPGYLISTNTTIPSPYPANQLTTISTKVTVMPGATLTLLSGNTLRFVENGQLIIQDGATLALGSNVTIQGQSSNNGIIVKGTLCGTSGNSVFYLNMSSLSNSTWKGIEFDNPQLQVVLHSCAISNSNLTGKLKKMAMDNQTPSQNNSSVTNGSISFDGTDLDLANCSFYNSNIQLLNNKRYSNISVKIKQSLFANSQADAIIQISHYPSGEITNNVIQYESGTGISLFSCGDNSNEMRISNCTIQKQGNGQATTWGVNLYRTLAELYNNVITDNDYGVASMNYSHVSLKGEINAQSVNETQQIKNNLKNQVRAFDNSFPYFFHYNQIDYSYPLPSPPQPIPALIYTDFGGSSIDPPDPYSNPNLPVNKYNITCNTFPSNKVFHPDQQYNFTTPDPSPPYNSCTLASAAQEAFEHAMLEMDSAHYSEAEDELKLLIENYPETIYTTEAAKKLIPIKLLSDRDFTGLKNYYDTSYNLHIDTLRKIMTERLKTQCDIENMNYEEAVAWFENRILDPPTFNDSIYAIIDLEDLYIIMSADSTQRHIHYYSGKLPEYENKSTNQFITDREKHIRLLFKEMNSLNHRENQNKPDKEELKIYPNPINNISELFYTLNQKGKVEICIRNILGETLISNIQFNQDSGPHKINIDMSHISNGIYIIAIKVNGIEKNQVKVLKIN